MSLQGVYAQDRQVSGTITDDETGEPLIGVNIVVKGTTTGTVSDFDGNYELKVPTGATLVYTFVGYDPLEMTVSTSGRMDVKLKATTFELNATTVTAGRRKERTLDAPASISVIEQKEIKNAIVTTPSDYVQNASGVDVVKTGMMSANIVVRGFNNIFSGSLLSLVDNRITAVPSLRVNTQYMISTNPGDIQRIEVLKGPASAMYGPNSANGVVHIITESPLDMKSRFRTTVSLAGGLRSKVDEVPIYDAANPGVNVEDNGDKFAYMGSLRHAANLTKGKNKKVEVGYKISGKYFLGNEWRYRDPFEPLRVARSRQSAEGNKVFLTDGTEMLETEVLALLSDTITSNDVLVDSLDNARPLESKIYNMEGRLDFRFNKKAELIFTGGVNSASGVELTGLGAGRADDWRYMFGQVRFIWKDLFAQVYLNASDAGGTYLLRDGNQIVDKSKFITSQIQHTSTLADDRLKLIYGFDALLTRPNTESTINGRNENDDNINEFGAYLQGDFKINEKFNILAALRADKHTFVEDIFLSPRAAFIYKPNYNQTLRLTYNRAFSSPSALNTSLDILSGSFPTGIDVRGSGNRNGFQFSYNDAGLPQYRSPFAALIGQNVSTYYNLGDNTMNNVVYNIAVGLLGDGLKQVIEDRNLPIPPAAVDSIIANILPSGVANVENLLRMFSGDASAPFGGVLDPASVKDFPAVKNSVTQTIELGYKGIINNRLALTVDVYNTRITDFVTPVVTRTPTVFLDGASVAAAVAAEITANMNDPANVGYRALVTAALDTAQVVQGITVNGNSNGDGTEELITLISAACAQIPFGTVAPTFTNDPSVLLTYSNFGDVSLFGAEIGASYFINDNFKVGANYARVSDDEFETDGITIALNAPKTKVGLSANYTWPKAGLDVGVRYRWQQSFPVNSGVYSGVVDDLEFLDLNVGYALPFSKNTQIALSMQNVLDNQQQMFVGAPALGRFTMLQISHTFDSN